MRQTLGSSRKYRGSVTLDAPFTLPPMPHAILRFRLPDEQSEFDAAMQGGAAKATLWAVDQHCRSILKHGGPSEETREHLEHIRQLIGETPGLLDD